MTETRREAVRGWPTEDGPLAPIVVVLSTGEVSPDFGDGPARFVCERDGKPLDTPRLVTPGDKHGTRDARDVVTITVE